MPRTEFERMTYDRNEFGTCASLLQATRQFLGGIDLDPASSDWHQEHVGAMQYFTKKERGELRKWTGRVWCNPPYGRGLCAPFVVKFLTEDFSEGFLLVNAAPSTRWSQWLLQHPDLACVWFDRRLAHYHPELAPDGALCKGNRYDQVMFYRGPRAARFAREFACWGAIGLPWQYVEYRAPTFRRSGECQPILATG